MIFLVGNNSFFHPLLYPHKDGWNNIIVRFTHHSVYGRVFVGMNLAEVRSSEEDEPWVNERAEIPDLPVWNGLAKEEQIDDLILSISKEIHKKNGPHYLKILSLCEEQGVVPA